jgi:hypothetical protein
MAKQPSSNTETGTPDRRKAELATLDADITALADAAECMEQSSVWTYNAWCAVDESSEREAHKKLYDKMEKLSTGTDELKAEVDALLKSYRHAHPTLARLAKPPKAAGQPTRQDEQPKGKRQKQTKSALVEEVKAKLTANVDKAQKVVRTNVKTKR